ncbi:MAG: restriction endonuclease [Defluviitaleaceae bacterium]|nr:restriction endonuclease [Defluviitaleaceae bacterium]
MEAKKEQLTIEQLCLAAKDFCYAESQIDFPELLGVTDGKAVGTFVEHRLKRYLSDRFDITLGNSASGIDLSSPEINTDIKVTSYRQPQSSCPYKSSRQKIFGLGYNLLVLVYDKKDENGTSKLEFQNCTFISQERTSDFTTTKRLDEMLRDGAIKEDIVAYFVDRNIPGDEITLEQLADEVLEHGVTQGYLTISNALQWRLQYQRVITLSNSVDGIVNYDYKK